MPFVNVAFAEGSVTLADALTTVEPFVTKAFSFMTQEPMIYYLVIGIIGGGIMLFGKAKRAAKH